MTYNQDVTCGHFTVTNHLQAGYSRTYTVSQKNNTLGIWS